MKKNDCINDCVGPDCEGCRNYKTMKALSEQIMNVVNEIMELFNLPKIKSISTEKIDKMISDIEQTHYPKEFVFWLGENDIQITDKDKWYNLYTDSYYTTDELYNYWKENIKDK